MSGRNDGMSRSDEETTTREKKRPEKTTHGGRGGRWVRDQTRMRSLRCQNSDTRSTVYIPLEERGRSGKARKVRKARKVTRVSSSATSPRDRSTRKVRSSLRDRVVRPSVARAGYHAPLRPSDDLVV